MSDLIDRDALRLMKVKECAGHTIEYAEGWKACIEWIKTLPSAEPERKKGMWTGDCCSCCGVSKYNYIKMVDDECRPFGTWNFCPHCGADMRGE